jgi:hypothetical protein
VVENTRRATLHRIFYQGISIDMHVGFLDEFLPARGFGVQKTAQLFDRQLCWFRAQHEECLDAFLSMHAGCEADSDGARQRGQPQCA